MLSIKFVTETPVAVTVRGEQNPGVLQGKISCFRPGHEGAKPIAPVVNRYTKSCSPSTAKRFGRPA